MVHVQPLHIESVLENIHIYLEKQNTPVKANTIANRIQITPKQARYVLRTYFGEYIRSDKMSTKRYYFKR